MAIEHLLFPTSALLMLAVALSSTPLLGAQPPRSAHRPIVSAPAPSLVLEGTLVEISLTRGQIMVKAEGSQKTYDIGEKVQVTKDKQSATLQTLAKGDRVTLTFAEASRKTISKIEAFSAK